MAKVTNTFLAGRMNSDVNYSLIDNKEYVYALNLRPAGYGKDGTMHAIKGSKLVSDYSENGTMTVVGMFDGDSNKLYTFLARRDGLSKITETDIITEETRLIIEDAEFLRFDMLRWENCEEIKTKYLLSIDQIGDLLFFSSDEWEYPRVINITTDYSGGFELEDIILAKKPPMEAPNILEMRNKNGESNNNDDNDVFVSFAYRYKYIDGDFSALSFYSDTAFSLLLNPIKINSNRENETMVNEYDHVRLGVNSGGKNVTDIEVYAIEHGSNTAYMIYSANKKQMGISDNADIVNIEYSFSKNYTVLDEEDTKLLYSNIPKYPKTQEAVGNRIFYANYKEGYDIEEPVNFKIENRQTSFNEEQSRRTAVSLFKYKIGVVYYNDFNESSTVLLPTDQTRSEIEIGFDKRLQNNNLFTILYTKPPEWATKMKWVVKGEILDYENVQITNARRLDNKAYLLLSGNNRDRIKKDDILIMVSKEKTTYHEFSVEDVKALKTADGIPIDGLYAIVNDEDSLIKIEKTAENILKQYNDSGVIDNADYSDNPKRFYAKSGYSGNNYMAYNSIYNSGKLHINDFGIINEGDELKIKLTLEYSKEWQYYNNNYPTGPAGTGVQVTPFGNAEINISIYATKKYDNIYDFLKENNPSHIIEIQKEDNNILLLTNENYLDYLKSKLGDNFYYKLPKSIYGATNSLWDIFLIKVKSNTRVDLNRGTGLLKFRTKNKPTYETYYYETPKTYKILNGKIIADRYDADGNPIFDIGFYNGYCWGDGFESYKIKDMFNGKPLRYNFRPNAVDKNGYKRVHRKYDITYSGLYNYELGINKLSIFNPSLANWKTMPIHYGEIQRIISTDGDITVFCIDKVINQYYGKSILADLQGNENVAISNDVLGGYQELPYTFGTQHPESVVKSVDGIYFVDKKRTRYLFKTDRQIFELNPEGSGHHYTGVNEIKKHDSFLSYYNDAHGEVVFGLGHDSSVVFNPQAKGFSHYYDYSFDYAINMEGISYTAYKGKVYEDEATDQYNVFAGGQRREAKITYVVNPEMASDKVYQAMYIQSNTAWNTAVKTNLTASEFSENVYAKKESYYYTEIYRDNATNKSMVGAGRIQRIDGNSLHYKNDISNQIAVGDTLHNQDLTFGSDIIDIQGNIITIADATGLSANDFTVASKKYYGSYRPGGVPIRGEWMEVTLSKDGTDANYINAVNTEIIKSFR